MRRTHLMLTVAAACLAPATAHAQTDAGDPWEGFNRNLFAVHETVDRAVLEPVARGYRAVTPSPVRQGVVNFLRNLRAPVTLGFKLAGVPNAGLLAFVVMLLAIVQIGAAIVLFPVIIWLWSAKDFTTALALTLFFLVVGVLDNVLKPLVMGRGLTTPALVIFVGVIGGTLAPHGIVGLFVGPIILAVAWELITAWIRDDRARQAGER